MKNNNRRVKLLRAKRDNNVKGSFKAPLVLLYRGHGAGMVLLESRIGVEVMGSSKGL